MKKKSGHRRRTKVVRRSRKNLRRTIKRKRLGKGRRRPTRRYSRIQRGGRMQFDKLECFLKIGDMFETGGPGVAKDYNMAARMYKYAADDGDAQAQYKLGVMYDNGRGVANDDADAQAVKYFEKAAEQEHAGAQFNLGAKFEHGKGVEMDIAKAIEYYKKAAEQGNAKANFNLGWLHETGFGVPKNKFEAIKFYQLAAEQGHKSSEGKILSLQNP